MTKKSRVESPATDSPWFRVEAAAAYLRLAPGTIRNMTWAGTLPACKRGRIVRYHKDDLDAWLRGEDRSSHSKTQ